jgi:hypothetical protein
LRPSPLLPEVAIIQLFPRFPGLAKICQAPRLPGTMIMPALAEIVSGRAAYHPVEVRDRGLFD